MYNPIFNMKVVKRDGTNEDLNLDKIHKMVELACEGLTDVSPSYVETNSKLQFFDGITTEYIQDVLVSSANKLISLETPNYQYVAARLLLFGLYKSLSPKWQTEGLPSIYDHLNKYSTRYDSILLEKYTKREWDILDGAIDHIKDFKFTYASLQQLMDKYLIQDRSTGQVFETPQIAYMLIAATVFSDYPKETRLEHVIDYYHAISDHHINLPTPIMAGVRSKLKSFASCSLLDVDDTTLSIGTSNHAVGVLTASSSGIGLNVGRMRSIDSSIRDGNVIHPGVIPFLKMFESTAKAFKQANRGGCFLKDTKVVVLSDTSPTLIKKNIQDIVVGDTVLSYDHMFKRNTLSKVLTVWNNHTTNDRQMEIVTNKDTIFCTKNHKIWEVSKGWVSAESLKLGDKLLSSIGDISIVEDLGYTEHGEQDYYDLEVEDTKCYFVGTNDSILVHNSVTCFFPIWHLQIESIIQLKNNRGTEDTRVRHMDYCIQMSELFYKRFITNENITLFSTSDVPGLYESFGTDKFDDLYEYYESQDITKKVVNMQQLFMDLVEERSSTARVYIMNIDHANSHSPYQETVYMSNLCVAPEVGLLTNKGYLPIGTLEDQPVTIWNGEEWSDTVVRKTGVNQSLITVEFDYGYYTLDCTPYHKFPIIAGDDWEFVCAKDLVVGDVLIDWEESVGGGWNRNVRVSSIKNYNRKDDTYCLTESKRNMMVVNGILTGQCVEIIQPARPLQDISDTGIREYTVAVQKDRIHEFANLIRSNDFLEPKP